MSSKSLEELLAILGDDVPSAATDDVEMFIEEFDIKSSPTDRVSARVIYWFYMKWKEQGEGVDGFIYSRRKFFRRFIKHFEAGRCDDRYYKIESTRFKVTRWEKEELQRDLKQSLKEEKRERLKRLRRKSQKKRGTSPKPQG